MQECTGRVKVMTSVCGHRNGKKSSDFILLTKYLDYREMWWTWLLHKMHRDALILSRNAYSKIFKKHGEMFVDVRVQTHGIYLGVW